MTMLAHILTLAVVLVGTWNGKWFPSGRAEHRASPEREAQTISAAGQMLRSGLSRLDPLGTNDLILCFNEIRGPEVARELCSAIGRTNLSVAIVTAYRRRDRFDQQQDVIMTTLPVLDATWKLWKRKDRIYPPRGYAHARLRLPSGAEASVYAVHLKSNYGATTEELRLDNRAKRAAAIGQLISQEPRGSTVIIAGDFNADRWRAEFADETIFEQLEKAGFDNPLADLPAASRATYPSRRHGDSTLDYIMLRGMRVLRNPLIESSGSISDHDAVLMLCQ